MKMRETLTEKKINQRITITSIRKFNQAHTSQDERSRFNREASIRRGQTQ